MLGIAEKVEKYFFLLNYSQSNYNIDLWSFYFPNWDFGF